MSIIDVFFISLYGLCAYLLGRYGWLLYGPGCGILGALIGFMLPMLAWRGIDRCFDRNRAKKPNQKHLAEENLED